jgi:drug/metabolite transporter (DMT)-like permease
MKPSVAIPVNNIGVVLLSAIAAIFFFKESATPRRIAGLALSVIAILLIAFSDAGS